MNKDNIIGGKSKEFAIRIVKLYKYLSDEKNEYTMSKQILKSGTSIGANVKEAVYAQSKKDFISKMNIALKEAAETEYWLEILSKTEYLTEDQYESMSQDCKELIKLLIVIVKSSKKESAEPTP